MAKKILVVDDEPHIVNVLSVRLRMAGYEVICAVGGQEGLTAAVQEKPDLVITDLQMPEMDGIAMINSIHGQEATRNVPVIIMSASRPSFVPEGFAAFGIRDFISKPFSPGRVVVIVDKILGQTRPPPI